ncbi:MAG: isoaspartyl peptidase/L-asparaginase, partial [Planctomycetes bacterium]|nr:isoaspartyl peptidase/L-asparaginase [Planctomycetota bacterium]
MGAAAATAAGAASGAIVPETNTARPQEQPPRKGPIVMASANGVATCNLAIEKLRAGESLLDAVVAGVTLVEDNPKDMSVGYGGLPNEDGVVELDSCVMDGLTHKAGGVASIQNIRNPAKVALLVMRRTDHVLIVGDGARRFAVAHGFKEQDMLTPESRARWLKWKESLSDRDDWLSEEEAAGKQSSRFPELEEFERHWGTINCCALDANGNLGGVTTTSGLSFKIPGRVGDSPIIGAGLYVDNDAG